MTTAPTEGLRNKLAERRDQDDTGPAAPTLRDQVKAMEQQWANALPRAVSPDRFVRTVLTEVSKTPRLAECDVSTFLGACTASAQLGLEFGPLGLAYLVPFYNNGRQRLECQLIVGYKGYLQLARRSTEVKDIIAKPVYEGDEYDRWDDESGTHMIHRPTRRDHTNEKPILYWFRCTTVTGGAIIDDFSPEQIEERKQRSQSSGHKSSPWNSDPLAMALKTCVRMMIPWLPLATETAQNLAYDEQVIRLRGTNLVAEEPPAIIEGEVVEPERGPEAAGPDEGTQAPPEPAPEAPADAEADSGDSDGGDPDDAEATTEQRIMAILDTWDEQRLNDVCRQFGLDTRGRPETRQLRLLPVLVQGYVEGDPAVLELL